MSLRHLKNSIRQIFCKHNWENIEEDRFSETLDDQRFECFAYTKKCVKCGKIERCFEKIYNG